MSETGIKVPKTLRERLMMEREELYETRDIIHKAIMELLSGSAITSYVLQNRSVSKTRADLSSLKTYMAELDNQIDEIEAILSGRPQRQSTTNVYLNPQNTIPPFWFGGFNR